VSTRRWACAAARKASSATSFRLFHQHQLQGRESRCAPISGGDEDGNALERKSKQRRTAASTVRRRPDQLPGRGRARARPRAASRREGRRAHGRSVAAVARPLDASPRPPLRLQHQPEFRPVGDGSQRYVAFVNNAVAFRASQTKPALQHLAISFTMARKHKTRASVLRSRAGVDPGRCAERGEIFRPRTASTNCFLRRRQ
jgi:hypothetical protein